MEKLKQNSVITVCDDTMEKKCETCLASLPTDEAEVFTNVLPSLEVMTRKCETCLAIVYQQMRLKCSPTVCPLWK